MTTRPEELGVEVAPGVLRVRADNPSHMTLTGTNSYLIDRRILIDPGPDLEPHLDALARFPIETVLISHRHRDHTGGIDGLVARRTGARVHAVLPEFRRDGAQLSHLERIEVDGGMLEVLATPGHTSDSLSFVLLRDGADRGHVFTADTILGGVTTVLDHPDGALGDFLSSLDLLTSHGDEAPLQVLPAHGEPIADVAAESRRLRAHRLRRLEQVADVREQFDDDVALIARHLYRDAPEAVMPAAEHTVLANLAHLQMLDSRDA